VTLSLSAKAADFLDSVLRLQPRLAVFDCDGTLWAGDAGEGFFDWELARGVVSDEIVRWARPRYADYKASKVSEDDMCAEMVTMHRGLAEAEVQRAADEYFNGFASAIFPEMHELVQRLRDTGCEVWAVSSTNVWVIRAAMKYFAIPQDRILAASVRTESGRITDQLIRVPTGDGKTRAIHDVIRKTPDAAFGNTRWDTEMLQLAKHAFAVNPTPDLKEIARRSAWRVYWPDSVRK
jgi:phosphoserine phosphatase